MDLESEITDEKRRCNETLSTYQQQAAQANAFKREADDAAKEKPMLAGIGVNLSRKCNVRYIVYLLIFKT